MQVKVVNDWCKNHTYLIEMNAFIIKCIRERERQKVRDRMRERETLLEDMEYGREHPCGN
jgi:hypothetical protein